MSASKFEVSVSRAGLPRRSAAPSKADGGLKVPDPLSSRTNKDLHHHLLKVCCAAVALLQLPQQPSWYLLLSHHHAANGRDGE
jgi:hypothetical protein